FTFYPTGLNENEIAIPARPTSIIEDVFVSNDKIDFIIVDAYEDSFLGYTLLVYIDNKTANQKLSFYLQGLVVNGYDSSVFWLKTVPASTRIVTTLNISKSSMELSGITSVDQIDLYLQVYDSEDYLVDDIVNDKYSFFPTNLSEDEVISPERPTSPSE